MQDLKYAFRMLKKRPAFTVVAVLTLRLGHRREPAIFSVVNALMLKPLPFPQPVPASRDRRSRYGEKGNEMFSLSYPDFFDLRDQNRGLAELPLFIALTCPNDQVRKSLLSVTGAKVAPNFSMFSDQTRHRT